MSSTGFRIDGKFPGRIQDLHNIDIFVLNSIPFYQPYPNTINPLMGNSTFFKNLTQFHEFYNLTSFTT